MDGHSIIRKRDALKAARNPFEGHWDELAEIFMPFRCMKDGGLPEIPAAREVFDSSPRQAALIMANGLASLVTPREETWFEFAPPRAIRDDEQAVAWYRQCSATAREYIERSNFYEEIGECLIEAPVFGTAALFLGDLDDYGRLYFRCQPVKTYYITEDAAGRVNSLCRELDLTAEQAATEFGQDNLPPAVRGALGSPDKAQNATRYIHCVYRRNYQTPPADDPGAENETGGRVWESVVVHEASGHVVARAGYHEFPFAVHRYRRFGRSAYGFGPGSVALSDARQLQFLNQLADVATEKQVFPPVIAPSSLEGEVARGALEITYVDASDPNAAAMLREWSTTSRYDICMDRMAAKRGQVQDIFHVPLFNLFQQRAAQHGPLTATEASLMAGEKLTQFSPVFGRLVSEMLDPVLNRVFGVLLRAGVLGAPPPSVVRAMGSRAGVAAPSLLYKNRIMLAMQQRENANLMDFMALVTPLLNHYPQAMDALRLPEVVRTVARNNGLPEEWLRSQEEMQAIEQARAEQADAAMQMQQAEQAASAAQKLSAAAPGLADRAMSGL
jgi:hypothetical protein